MITEVSSDNMAPQPWNGDEHCTMSRQSRLAEQLVRNTFIYLQVLSISCILPLFWSGTNKTKLGHTSYGKMYKISVQGRYASFFVIFDKKWRWRRCQYSSAFSHCLQQAGPTWSAKEQHEPCVIPDWANVVQPRSNWWRHCQLLSHSQSDAEEAWWFCTLKVEVGVAGLFMTPGTGWLGSSQPPGT